MAILDRGKMLDLGFSESLVFGRELLNERLGRMNAETVRAAMRTRYQEIRPRVPRLKSLYAQMLMMGAVYALPLYLAVRRHLPEAEALDLAREHVEACGNGTFKKHMPWPLRRAWKNPFVNARATQVLLTLENLLDDPLGWKYELVPTRPGHLIDYNVTRCGIHMFFLRMGVPELTAGAVCPYDHPMTENFFPPGTRLTRTGLLSQGAACCDFRYRLER